MRRLLIKTLSIACAGMAFPAHAQTGLADSGDTAWVLICSLFIIGATLIGLMLRYASGDSFPSIAASMARIMAFASGAAILWGIIGYSLSFAPGRWIGDGTHLMLSHLAEVRDGWLIPESAFVFFQMAAAVFACLLTAGGISGHVRFGWGVSFSSLWLLLIYAPICHALWGGGWLASLGVMDFSGSLVIHLSAGVAVLMLALITNDKRAADPIEPNPFTLLMGSTILWFGGSAIIGGWAMSGSDDAATALLNTMFATCTAALAWGLADGLLTGQVRPASLMSGALAGLAAISASAPLVGTGGAMIIGIIAAIFARLGVILIARIAYDPTNAIAIHGLGGLIGALLLPIFAMPGLGGVGFEGAPNIASLVGIQMIAIAVIIVWSALGTFIVGMMVSNVMALPPEGSDTKPAAANGMAR